MPHGELRGDLGEQGTAALSRSGGEHPELARAQTANASVRSLMPVAYRGAAHPPGSTGSGMGVLGCSDGMPIPLHRPPPFPR